MVAVMEPNIEVTLPVVVEPAFRFSVCPPKAWNRMAPLVPPVIRPLFVTELVPLSPSIAKPDEPLALITPSALFTTVPPLNR